MIEKELKFEVKNFVNLRPILQKLGSRLIWKGKEKNFYFDTQDKKLEKSGTALRIREWQNHSNTLTLKIPAKQKNESVKVREELQIEINNIQTAARILNTLGFVKIFYYQKNREHWKLKNASIELDKIKNKYFVEIEASQKIIKKLTDILNLDWKKSTTKDYPAILKELN